MTTIQSSTAPLLQAGTRRTLSSETETNASGSATGTEGTAAAALKKTAMDQSDFFKLMIAQLKNQDPTKPVDGQQQLAQLAQFTTLQSIQEFQASFEAFASDIKAALASRETPTT